MILELMRVPTSVWLWFGMIFELMRVATSVWLWLTFMPDLMLVAFFIESPANVKPCGGSLELPFTDQYAIGGCPLRGGQKILLGGLMAGRGRRLGRSPLQLLVRKTP